MILNFLGSLLARYLSKQSSSSISGTSNSPEILKSTLVPGDVILVEGNLRYSTAIKYLTQSTWSHAALYVGEYSPSADDQGPRLDLLEADLEHGVTLVAVEKYASFHTRICRPVGLSKNDIRQVIQFALSKLGNVYDLKNIIDLMRYLMPIPPVPTPWRRRLLSLGSGEPTKAICSSVIAQAFQSIRYPILPDHLLSRESYSVRHHSLFVPRDFDVSPYFQIVKPTLASGFDYHKFSWDKADKES